mmetsp:Transcript_11486/g.33857  ORF Transcript_11486/g.33857 Transcript_11486/m.33857 type:complete len:344 (-) Transcript_11486:102-1133(-)
MPKMSPLPLTLLIASLILLDDLTAGLASSPPSPRTDPRYYRSVLVTGANKGQGFALCERILSEHEDTRVFLCSRDNGRGEAAAAALSKKFSPERVEAIQLDVTDAGSVQAACAQVRESLGDKGRLFGVVSNAGVLWGYTLKDLMEVCAIGVRTVLDTFLPLVDPDGGRIIVVSSGLSPLMYGYASPERQKILNDEYLKWNCIQSMIDECYDAEHNGGTPENYENIGFPGGPFADSAPDFHKYGLAKMFADVYMRKLARSHPNLRISSCDPGLVYTDLMTKIPRYEGKDFEETGAKSPTEGAEAAMRLLFGGVDEAVHGDVGGRFFAMKGAELLSSDINKRPDV